MQGWKLNPESESEDLLLKHKYQTQYQDYQTLLETLPIPQKVVVQLHNLAKWMIQAGQDEECYNIYRDIRAKELIEKMNKHGVEELSTDDVENSEWPHLEECMMHWVRLLATLVTEFAFESLLCDQVFHELEPYWNKCFLEVTGPTAMRLLNFVENVVQNKAEPEKLFAFLEMYGILDELHSQIKVIFELKSSVSVYEAFYSMLGNLSKTIDEIVQGVIENIEKDNDLTNFNIQDGGVHPLNEYLIKYINRMLRYRTTLNHAFGEENTIEPRNSQLLGVVKHCGITWIMFVFL